MESSKRLDWVDICKAIAIYLMVLGHTGVSEGVNIFIHAFHMPVFFLLSGYCFNEVKNRDFIAFSKKKNFATYFTIYNFWNRIIFVLGSFSFST